MSPAPRVMPPRPDRSTCHHKATAPPPLSWEPGGLDSQQSLAGPWLGAIEKPCPGPLPPKEQSSP